MKTFKQYLEADDESVAKELESYFSDEGLLDSFLELIGVEQIRDRTIEGGPSYPRYVSPQEKKHRQMVADFMKSAYDKIFPNNMEDVEEEIVRDPEYISKIQWLNHDYNEYIRTMKRFEYGTEDEDENLIVTEISSDIKKLDKYTREAVLRYLHRHPEVLVRIGLYYPRGLSKLGNISREIYEKILSADPRVAHQLENLPQDLKDKYAHYEDLTGMGVV